MGRKRANGEGMGPRKRPDGRWEIRIPRPQGSPKSIYGKTQKEVLAKRDAHLLAQQQGRDLGEPSQKLGSYLRSWLDDYKRNSVKPTTLESYELNTRRILPHLGHYRLDMLKPSHVQHCYAALEQSGLSAYSVNQAHRTLRAALRHAARLGLIGRNPLDATSPPRMQRRDMEPLTEVQVRVLLAQEDDPLLALWALLVSTGLRIGEALGLRWEDVNLETGTLLVKRTMHWQRGKGMAEGSPKTDRSRRAVHFPKILAVILRAHGARQKAAALGTGRSWSTVDLVFATGTGQPLNNGYVRQAFRRCLARAELPIIRIHDLRHTAATILLGRGIHPKVVQEMLGHSSITLTMDTYSHFIPALHKDAAEQMGLLFGSHSSA